MNRRGFLGGLAAAVVATAAMTRLGKTLADVLPKADMGETYAQAFWRESRFWNSAGQRWQVERLGGHMYSEELSRELRKMLAPRLSGFFVDDGR